MADYPLKQGEYLTIKGTAVDDDGAAVDVSSGYTFIATIKSRLSDTDAEALVHVDSSANAARFSVVTSTVSINLLTSAESNAADPGSYFYDAWAVETASGEEVPIDRGTISIARAVSITKTP